MIGASSEKLRRRVGQTFGGQVSQKVIVDDSRWPILLVTQMAEQLTDAERLDSLERSSQVLTSHGSERYAMVLDNRKAGPMPPTQRKLIADYMARHAIRSRTRCACMALVSDSAVMRAMLTAITWLRKPEVETRVFGRLDEAIAWARTTLDHSRTSES